MGCLISHHLPYKILHPPVLHKPRSDPAPGKGNNLSGHNCEDNFDSFLTHTTISFEPWFILISRNSICFCCSSPKLCVRCFNELHSTDIKGTSTTLLNLFLLGASKICFSKSLRRSIKSPSPTGKQCPFPAWPRQSNQRRHLRTGCTILENEIALKKIPPRLFAR